MDGNTTPISTSLPNLVFGLDPGSALCGCCLLDIGRVKLGFEGSRTEVFSWIREQSAGNPYAVIIEDVRPFSRMVSQDVIDTCKAIGELTYRFNMDSAAKLVRFTARNQVRKWAFDTFPEVCRDRLAARMIHLDNMRVKNGKKSLRMDDGEMRAASFHFIDDRIMAACMRFLHDIPVPKPGKRNIYGLKGHSWQALAVVSHFLHTGG